MATNALPTGSGVSRNQSKQLTATDIATAILAPLASLKLTVFLLVMSIIVVFIATLQQASMDMWSVKNMHYDNWFVVIPFKAVLIERWFPSYQDVQGSFVIPSGKLIIYALIVNLVAAHLLRFRVKAKGVKLWIGLVTAVIAGVVTWAMSFNTLGADGFQKSPPVSYSQMWLIMQVILLGLSLSCMAGIFITTKGKIEKALLGTFAFLAGSVLAISIVLGKDAFVGDAGMRILWQLAQSTVAACVAFGACVLLFQRKAGIVLLHIGVVGLMANELYVTYTNEENRMQFAEGETTSLAFDIRETEFVVVDMSNFEYDAITAIPESVFRTGDEISDEELPFKVKCVEFIDNSRLQRLNAAPNEAMTGIGVRWGAVNLPQSTSDEVDIASARVELIDRSGKSLGQWFVSQMLWDQNFADTVEIDDKKYRIGLRFKTKYKPYALTLNDVKAEYYTGTSTPSWFSSKLTLTDLETETSSEHETWMNNPLRYNGETFYQSGYNAMESGEEVSTLQVVKNRGWMIPYICCMFTVVGLVGQFGSSLLAHLKKAQSTPSKKKEIVTEGVAPERKSRWRSPGFLIPTGVGAVTLVLALYGIPKSMKPVIHEDGMRLDRFGEIPITFEGRIQPLDSFARNTARQFSKREEVYDKDLKKQPAIRWLADSVFQADGFDKYRLFRIEDLEILGSLNLPTEFSGLPKGAHFRYSLDQLKNAPEKIIPILPPPKTPESQYSTFQARLAKILSNMQKSAAVAAISMDESASVAERLNSSNGRPYVELGDTLLPTSSRTEHWPRFFPKGDQWELMVAGENRNWIKKQAKEFEASGIFELYDKLVLGDEEFAKFRQNQRFELLTRELLTPNRIAAAKAKGAKTQSEIVLAIIQSEEGAQIERAARLQVDRVLTSRLASMNENSNEFASDSDSLPERLANKFSQIGIAYRAGDAAKFNELTEDYLSTIREEEQVKGAISKLGVERVYNGWSPFYMCLGLYLLGFLAVALSWCFSSGQELGKQFGRIAIAIVAVALVVHIAGIVMRVYISGRPPVTNLYSSAIAVSAIFVLIMLIVEAITRMGVGTAMGCVGAFGALMWAWSMTIIDGDTFTVLVAVLDTQFWLSTHVVCISIGYAINFAAGFIALAYILKSMFTSSMDQGQRKQFANTIYGVTCFALFFSFFGTVLGGLWGDDSWGRFWGWDPKENGALMIVLWSALLLHARWGGLVKERGIAILAVLGNIVVLWSWKGVNSMGVGLHAYAASEDDTVFTILMVGVAHLLVALIALVPTKFWLSHAKHG